MGAYIPPIGFSFCASLCAVLGLKMGSEWAPYGWPAMKRFLYLLGEYATKRWRILGELRIFSINKRVVCRPGFVKEIYIGLI